MVIIEGAHLQALGRQPLLLLIQWLIYGSSIFTRGYAASSAKKTAETTMNANNATLFTTKELPGLPFGDLIPLEQFGFSRPISIDR